MDKRRSRSIALDFRNQGLNRYNRFNSRAITFANWTSTADRPRNQSFVQNYMENYGIVPNTFAAECYTAVYILAKAVKRAQSRDSVAIRDAMTETSDLDTVLGDFSFDAVGDSVYNPIILVVENSKFETFE